MATKVETNDEESFIVLGTSPGASMELNGFYGDKSIDNTQLDDALKDLSAEASMAFKAHFKLGDTPSPASLMAASTIVTEDRSTEELQKRFGELLDENLILKETLKTNNDSMKEQFLVIASCQEDMMKTHLAHKEKFDETRELVEKLRQENKKLKQDISELQSLATSTSQSIQPQAQDQGEKSGPSSALEFVTSPDDDTIYKLTAQLELVEKQRRQVIVDNDKLTWQKESLERIVDAITKERDELKDKVRSLELQLSSIETDYTERINHLNRTIQDMDTKLRTAQNSRVSLEERDSSIQQLEKKIFTLQTELKNSQLKILDLENYKLEWSKQKAGTSDAVRIYKDQIQELSNRLKEAQTTVFQPVRFSISESESSNSEYAGLIANVKLYDKTLKHLSDLLNLLTHGASDSLVQTLGLVTSLHDFKLDRTSADQFKASLAEVKLQLEKQHSDTLKNVGQVRGTLTIFEGIFKDHNELLKKVLTTKQQVSSTKPANVEVLSSALVARGQELQALEAEVKRLKEETDERDLLRAQMELYKSDFEAERESREKMACEKENILAALRTTQRRNQELLLQMEEVRKLNPNIYKSATTRRSPPQTAHAQQRPAAARPGPATSSSSTTGNMLQLSSIETDFTERINHLNRTMQDMDTKLRTVQNSRVSLEERDSSIQQLEKKIFTLQTELKNSQLKILDLENYKLEWSKQKAGTSDAVRIYKDQIQELSNRLKEAQTTVFQPVRFSISESESSNSEYAGLIANVKLYDKTLKHLSDLLNLLTHGASDSLVQTLGLVTSLHDFKLDRTSADQFKASLAEVKLQLEKQHSDTLKNVGQVRGTLTIFEGIFKDHNELLKKVLTTKQQVSSTKLGNVEVLSSALVARGQELQALEAEVKRLKEETDERDLLRAQMELYKSDFEAERESREKMACEKENILADLRTTQRRNQELLLQMEEVRKLNPNIYKSATTRRSPPQTAHAQQRPAAARPGPATSSSSTTGNMVYTCPKCMRFSTVQYKVMEDHFDFCLDDF